MEDIDKVGKLFDFLLADVIPALKKEYKPKEIMEAMVVAAGYFASVENLETDFKIVAESQFLMHKSFKAQEDETNGDSSFHTK